MVKMVLGSSDAQASSVASLADSYSTAFNNIISAVDSLGNSDKLKGSAYTNVKTYTRSVVTPLAKGMILLADAAKADTKLLPDRYRSDVGEDDLSDDTEVLAAEIAALDATINANNTALGGMEADDPNKTTIEGAVKSDTAERDKRQKKLNKINAYDAASPSFFSDIAGLEANLNSGLSLLQSGVAGFNGTFPLPSKKQLQWADSINKDYKQYQDYQSAVAKAKKGEKLSQEEAKAIEAYQKAHPNLKLDEKVRLAKEQHHNQKSLYEQFKDVIGSNEAKRLSQLMALLPKNFTKAVLKSDGLWEILAAVEKTGAKGDKFVTAVLSGLSKYESMGKFGENISKGFKWLEKAANPLKSATKWGLEKVSGFKTLEEAVKTGKNFVGEAKFLGKGIKFLGKVGTVATVAQLGFEGLSGGINEFSKSKNIGKAVGKGALSAVSSVGPLEGATIGAAVGGVPGAFIGVGAGLIIQGIKAWKPKFFDDPIKGTQEMVSDVGNGIKGAVNAVSNAIGGVGKALGFG